VTGKDPVSTNRGYWNRESAEYQKLHGDSLTRTARAWGVWRIPESELDALGEVAGKDVLELGCGAAQWSIALAEDGARVVGMDLSDEQLSHARTGIAEAGARVPLVHAPAQRLPFRDESFDLVFCDHGAMSFADPRETLPEAARVLRPDGLLSFCMPTPWLWVAWDWDADALSDRLHADYFELGPQPVPEGYFEYQLPYGEWIRLARAAGFEVEDLIELRPPEEATSTYDLVSAEWARRWPAEHIWKLRRRG